MSNTIYSDRIKVNCPLVHDENGYYHLIYQVTNKKNGKVYVGKHSTKDPYDSYLGTGKLIIRAVKRYKPENFTKELLFCFVDEKEAYLKEAEIVTQEFVDRDDTYNVITGGYGFSSEDVRGEKSPWYGKHHKQETKDKISSARKGKYAGEKNPMYEKHHTQESKDKMSKSHKGKQLKQETKDKISKANSGENNPNYGKHLSQETKDKMSKSHKGKKLTQETKDKMSKSRKGIRVGAKSPGAKAVLKLDESGNIITEYGCMNNCCEQEHIHIKTLRKYIKEHTLHNGFYFEYKSKN